VPSTLIWALIPVWAVSGITQETGSESPAIEWKTPGCDPEDLDRAGEGRGPGVCVGQGVLFVYTNRLCHDDATEIAPVEAARGYRAPGTANAIFGGANSWVI